MDKKTPNWFHRQQVNHPLLMSKVFNRDWIPWVRTAHSSSEGQRTRLFRASLTISAVQFAR
jgi:hypothetical protein